MSYDIRVNVVTSGGADLDKVDAVIQKLSGSTNAASGTLKTFEQVLRADVAAGNSFSAALKTIASTSEGGFEGLAKLAQEAQRFSVVAVEAGSAAGRFTAATRELGAAQTAMVPQVAAASAAIRTAFGDQSIRAVERFSVSVLGLGPLFQKIFPLVGAIAFGEQIVRASADIIKMAAGWGGVTAAEKEATAEAARLDTKIREIAEKIAAINLKDFTQKFGATAGKAIQAADKTIVGPLEAQVRVNAAYADLAAKLQSLPPIGDRPHPFTQGRTVAGLYGQFQITGNDAIESALDYADAQAKKFPNSEFAKQYRAVAPYSKGVTEALATQQLVGAEGKSLSRDVLQGSATDTQKQRNSQTELDNEAARQATEAARRRKEINDEVKRQADADEDRRRVVAGFGKKALTPIEELQSRRDETLRRNTFSPSETAAIIAGSHVDQIAELSKQLAEASKLPLSLTGLDVPGNKALRDKPESLLGAGGENDIKRTGEVVLASLKQYNEEQNRKVNEGGAAAVRANAASGAFADKTIGINPQLTEAQKILALHQQDLATAQEAQRLELDAADKLATLDEQKAARDKANSAYRIEALKIEEEAQERIGELQNKQIADFRNLVGGIFEAVASRQPRALPNFVKSQVLSQAGTFVENAAQQYLLPSFQKVIPQLAGPLAKGTMFEKTDVALPANTMALQALTTAVDQNTASRGGGTSDQPGSLGTDVNGNSIPNIDAGPIGGLTGPNANPLALIRALSLSPSGGGGGPLASIGGNFGAGVSSVMSGNALSILLGQNGNPNGSGGPTTTSAQVGAGVGIAGALAAGGYGIYSGLKQGGAGGDLKAAGSAAGLAGGIVSNVAKLMDVAGPLLKAIPIVGSIAALALPLIGGLFNGPQQRANAINTELGQAQYVAPQALNVTQDSSGAFTDFDARGNIRTSAFSAVPTVRQGSTWEQTHGLFGGPPTFYNVPGGQTSQFGAPVAPAPPPAPIIIQAMDSQSFADFAQRNHPAIGNAAATALQNAHGALATEVQRAAKN